MRIEPLNSKTRVYLSESEYKLLLDSAPKIRTYFATRIEAECSPRIGRLVQIECGDFFVPSDPGVEATFLKLRGTKDTTKGESSIGGEARITWVPHDLYEELMDWADRRGLSEEDQLFDVGKKTIQDDIVVMRQNAARKSGDDDYLHYTSHDARVYYATNTIRRNGMNPEIVMEMGGWSSRKAIEPYLRKPLEKEMQDEVVRCGMNVIDDLPSPPHRDEFKAIYEELRKIREVIDLDNDSPLKGLTADEIATMREQASAEKETQEEYRDTALMHFSGDDSANSDVLTATAAGAAVSLAGRGGRGLRRRARAEERAMAANPKLADPTPEHAATMVMAAVVPALALVSAIALGDGATAAGGMLLGAGYSVHDIDLRDD